MTASELAFSCLLLKQPKGFTALCLDVDVASEGATPAKAKQLLGEAVELYLDSAIENNLPYLRPVPREDDPRVLTPASVLKTFRLKVNLRVSAVA